MPTCNVQCVMYSVSCTVYHVLCVMYSVSCTVCHVQCVMYSESCTVCHVQCVMYCVSCTVCHVLCVMYSVSCTVCHVQCVLSVIFARLLEGLLVAITTQSRVVPCDDSHTKFLTSVQHKTSEVTQKVTDLFSLDSFLAVMKQLIEGSSPLTQLKAFELLNKELQSPRDKLTTSHVSLLSLNSTEDWMSSAVCLFPCRKSNF